MGVASEVRCQFFALLCFFFLEISDLWKLLKQVSDDLNQRSLSIPGEKRGRGGSHDPCLFVAFLFSRPLSPSLCLRLMSPPSVFIPRSSITPH